MEIVIITGLSGAGKSRAVNALEDVGYYCIDNMPPALIPSFIELSLKAKGIEQVGIVIDIRGKDFFSGIFDCFERLKKRRTAYKVLFLDAADEVLAKRYKETRRLHPLSQSDGLSIEDAIVAERALLAPIFDAADYVVDTSYLSVAQLRERVLSLFSTDDERGFQVTVISFGYKYGLPPESDLVLDVRCLDNPFYIDELKHKTGLDTEVCDYVMASEASRELLSRYLSFLEYSMPLYKSEGKSELVISVGCTGGKHRSVCFAELIARRLNELSYRAVHSHRDITKLL